MTSGVHIDVLLVENISGIQIVILFIFGQKVQNNKEENMYSPGVSISSSSESFQKKMLDHNVLFLPSLGILKSTLPLNFPLFSLFMINIGGSIATSTCLKCKPL